ncbi:hypothetical protein SDC9_191520 [bioreactor metagenome]|uniref:Uncharacterized protein n=1 Tax=bioreactor metagenome TaxID=1076179 RepID=A0A645I0J0_9ZZZZ
MPGGDFFIQKIVGDDDGLGTSDQPVEFSRQPRLAVIFLPDVVVEIEDVTVTMKQHPFEQPWQKRNEFVFDHQVPRRPAQPAPSADSPRQPRPAAPGGSGIKKVQVVFGEERLDLNPESGPGQPLCPVVMTQTAGRPQRCITGCPADCIHTVTP